VPFLNSISTRPHDALKYVCTPCGWEVQYVGRTLFLTARPDNFRRPQIRSVLAEETENRGVDAVFIPSDHGTGMLDLHVASKLIRHGGCIISIRMWNHNPPRDDDMTEARAHMQASIVKEMSQKDMRCVKAWLSSLTSLSLFLFRPKQFLGMM